MKTVKVIGGGLAGSEAAYYLAKNGVKVLLYDIKPKKFSPVHKSENFAELVCSNSLKSNDIYGNCAGLLKQEMRELGSLIMESADLSRVPAGNALAVNRNLFSEYITEKLKNEKNITVVSEEVNSIDLNDFTIVATGPLTEGGLYTEISRQFGELHFYDASAPIIDFESIDMENAFFGDRYDKGNNDHINCPMNKEEYLAFYSALVTAKRANLHEFEKKEVFEGCMPIEIMALRGTDTLRFGPLKPVGLTNPKTGRWAYATLQLRREDAAGSMYNMVGFQTNLTFGEQKRVFSLIPALKNAEFLRYGVMHRNTYINSPEILNQDYSLKEYPQVFFAGQITGVEGYIESAGSGLMAGIYCLKKLKNETFNCISDKTVLGSLAKYITTPNADFQPMNANFGILPPADVQIKDKSERKRMLAERSLNCVAKYKKEMNI